MKRLLSIFSTAIAFSVLFTGCTNQNKQYDSSEKSSSTVRTEQTGQHSQTEPVSQIPIEISLLSDDEVKEILNSQLNFTSSENIRIEVPEKTSVYTFTTRAGNDLKLSFEEYYEDFLTLFKYLFPENTIDEDWFFYYGEDSDLEYPDNSKAGNIPIRNFNKVKDRYDYLVSINGNVTLLYDESWFRGIKEWCSPVCLEIGNPLGAGYAIINKGKAVYLSGKQVYGASGTESADRYPGLESYDPFDFFDTVETYAPDSTKSFKLLDKEIPINEAVKFFENYINKLPCSESEVNTKMCVVEVAVLKVNNDTYGYYFLTTKQYDGILFDNLYDGTSSSGFGNYTSIIGNAFMVESDDVDYIYTLFRTQFMEEVSSYTEIIPLETAIKKVSSSLSNEVEFEVEKVDFIYSQKAHLNEDGKYTEDSARDVIPEWKFTLYNPNDNLVYLSYVNAITGEFRYIKIST